MSGNLRHEIRDVNLMEVNNKAKRHFADGLDDALYSHTAVPVARPLGWGVYQQVTDSIDAELS